VVFSLKEGVQMDYTATDDFNVITVATSWTLGGKLVTTQTRKKSRLWIYMVGGVVGAAAGAVAYLITRPPTDTTDNGGGEPEWDPALPSLPQTPR
jgi:hypothetical protein